MCNNPFEYGFWFCTMWSQHFNPTQLLCHHHCNLYQWQVTVNIWGFIDAAVIDPVLGPLCVECVCSLLSWPVVKNLNCFREFDKILGRLQPSSYRVLNVGFLQCLPDLLVSVVTKRVQVVPAYNIISMIFFFFLVRVKQRVYALLCWGLWMYLWLPDGANKQDWILRDDGQFAA